MRVQTNPEVIGSSSFVRSAVIVLAFVGLVWLLEVGSQVFLPFVLALVVGVVFAPLADQLTRLGAPRMVAALAVLLFVLGFFVVGFFLLYPVASEFFARLPLMWSELQQSLLGLKQTMQSVEEVQEQVTETLNSGADAATPVVAVPTVHTIIAFLPSIAAQIMVFVGILYFFLLTRTDIYAGAANRFGRVSRGVLCKAEAEVSRYFLTISTINAGFGTLVALMLSALGMPNAVYWGFGAFLVNFVLYLGPISFALCLLIAGLIVFDGAMSAAPAALYMMMNMTEGQFVTPSLVGRHMSVNPLLIFMSLVFWLWLWGPVGGVIAIPILVWLRQVNKAVGPENDAAPRPVADAVRPVSVT